MRGAGMHDKLCDRCGAVLEDLGQDVTFCAQCGAPILPKGGTSTIGPYEISGEIGRGGMGVVYKARSPRLGRTCALKVVNVGALTEADAGRFRNEAMLAARLSHPNIVPVYDAGEEHGLLYYVMEHIEGRALPQLIKEGTDASLRDGVRVLAKVAHALAYAHGKGIVHRDVKPDNILIDQAGEPHITDFGLAKGEGLASDVSRAGQPLGTPCYMPPEQANGEVGAIGPLSDVYSLGATLYHVITGRPPFSGPPVSVIVDVINREPVPPRDMAMRTFSRKVPEDLETICLRAMDKEARHRYPSALALAQDLDAWLEARPIRARRDTPLERLVKTFRGHRPVLAAGAVVLVMLALAAFSVGAMLLFYQVQAGSTLRQFGHAAAVQQAATVEHAIRSAMLEGRPEVARNLVASLRASPGLADLEVIRPDFTPAYPDAGGLHRTSASLERFRLSPDEWHGLVSGGPTLTRETRVDGEPVMTVYVPLPNAAECSDCHTPGGHARAVPDPKPHEPLAVLAVQRSLRDVESDIANHRSTTILVGGTAAALSILLVLVLGRLFGLGPTPRTFGSEPAIGPSAPRPLRRTSRARRQKNY